MTTRTNLNNETARSASSGLKVRSNVKAGGLNANHNETAASR